jgi:amino acid transporter
MWQTILASLAAPIIGALVGFLSGGGSRMSKRIEHHADILAKLEKAPDASKAMQRLILKEIGWLDSRATARNARKLNGGTLFWAVVFALITGASVYFLWTWAADLAEAQSAFTWVAIALLVLIGFFLMILTGVAFSTIYKPAKTPEERKADTAAKKKKRLEAAEARAEKQAEAKRDRK